ncbi:MAG TPA: hypothetical protein PLU87_03775 [Sedimentisphaerales bacterium]|nr:hypothetical protein [Sedimentisphaerales bacterium]
MRRTILAVAAVLVVTAAVRADVTPVTADPAHGLDQAGCREVLLFGVSERAGLVGDAASPTVHVPSEEPAGADEAIALKDGRSSFDFCLYALIGLGMCRSGHWVRRCSFGFIPEWYHSGAPQQIGHSHAVGPDAFCHAAACFVQPDEMPDRLMPLYRAGTIPILVRTSQSISDVLTSRAPPSMS